MGAKLVTGWDYPYIPTAKITEPYGPVGKRSALATVKQVTRDLAVSLTVKDLYEALQKDGMQPKDALIILNMFGFSTKEYVRRSTETVPSTPAQPMMGN